MNSSTVLIFALATIVHTTFAQVIGVGNALNRYGFGNNLSNMGGTNLAGKYGNAGGIATGGIATGGIATGGIASGIANEGVGYGEVSVVGELPVCGQTKVNGNLPVIGFVTFEGLLPAGGLVSVAEGCNGNFGNQIYY